MLLGLHDLLPVDVLSVAELVVLQDGHTARPDFGERAQTQGLQRGLHYVESTEVFSKMTATDNVEVPEGREVGEPRVVSLDVDEASDLSEGAEHLQLTGVHRGVARPEGEVLVDLLEPVEAGVEDGEAALQDGAVLETLNIPGVHRVGELADLGTGPVTGHTLALHSLQILETLNIAIRVYRSDCTDCTNSLMTIIFSLITADTSRQIISRRAAVSGVLILIIRLPLITSPASPAGRRNAKSVSLIIIVAKTTAGNDKNFSDLKQLKLIEGGLAQLDFLHFYNLHLNCLQIFFLVQIT